MPVEIRELVIRATVNPKQTQAVEKSETTPPQVLTEADRSVIVQAAVEQILRILKTSKER